MKAKTYIYFELNSRKYSPSAIMWLLCR